MQIHIVVLTGQRTAGNTPLRELAVATDAGGILIAVGAEILQISAGIISH
jgi:hypothetical protein